MNRRFPIRTLVVAALFGTLAAAIPARAADLAKAEAEVEKAEKALFGKGAPRSSTRAVAFFLSARKLLPEGPLAEPLAARIALGLATAYRDRKKFREEAEELKPWAEKAANRVVRWTASDQAPEPVKTLSECRARLADGKDVKDVLKTLEALRDEVEKKPPWKLYRPAADYLLGLAFETSRKPREAAAYYLIPAQQEADRVAAQGRRDAELEASRPKTPATIPPAEKPPGKLEGPYREAVNGGLDWLARFQASDGSWSEAALDAMSASDPLPPGRTKVYPQKFSGALALLAFLQAGAKPGEGAHGQALERGLSWVVENQDPGGKLPRGDADRNLLNHILYTWVLAEAVHALPDPEPYRGPLGKAVEHLLAARNPGSGWRYGIRPGDNDSEHTAHALIVLARARAAGVEVPEEALVEGLDLLTKFTDPVVGRTGYTTRGDTGAMRADAMKFKPADTSTAAALAARVLLGEDPATGLLARGYDTLWNCPPDWVPDRDINLKYAHVYTLAYGLRPGADANHNLKRAADLFAKNRETKGSAAGSWPPVGALAADGRIAATARAVLSILNARGVNLPEPQKPGTK